MRGDRDKPKEPPTLWDSFKLLEGALKTIIPPVERLVDLTDSELLGYAQCLDAQWDELGKEWTKRQMQKEAMQRYAQEKDR